MKRLAAGLTFVVLLIMIGCGGDGGQQPSTFREPAPSPTSKAIGAEESETCQPAEEGTDELNAQDLYVDLIMAGAQLREEDLPMDSQIDDPLGGLFSGGEWSDRREMAEKGTNEPLKKLEQLQFYGVLGKWQIARKLEFPLELKARSEFLPLIVVQVETTFFHSDACALRYFDGRMEEDLTLDPAVSSFVRAAGYDPPVDPNDYNRTGHFDYIRAGALVPNSTLIEILATHYAPKKPLTQEDRIKFREEGAALIERMATYPDFADIKQLLETLIARYVQQLPAGK